ncbi:MAG: hypothetical protein M0P71_01360 [Melioribacteraceae bacterium]|nr:hypothetical protein [Melioribacteraceae bacterium]
MDYLIRKHSQLLSSPVSVGIRVADGISDEFASENISMSLDLMHFHGGDSPEIAFNDVRAAQLVNMFLREGKKAVAVPAYPTAGYNRHTHTSDYDGGILGGARGVHSHLDAQHGGFAYAIFFPSIGIPMADWED